MKNRSLTLIISMVIAFSLLTGCGSGGAKKKIVSHTEDGVTVTLSNSNGFLQNGENQFEILLTKNKKPFDAGSVELFFEMQAMPPNMPYMKKPVMVKSTPTPGEYSAEGKIPMGGSWDVTINFNDGGESKSLHFSIIARK